MDLIQEIIKVVGVNEAQAKGGAGLLFKMAQDKLPGAEFTNLTKALPQIPDLIKSIPSSGGGLMGALSSLGGGKLGDLAGMAGSLSALKLDPMILKKFIPVILDLVKQKAGPELSSALSSLMSVK